MWQSSLSPNVDMVVFTGFTKFNAIKLFEIFTAVWIHLDSNCNLRDTITRENSWFYRSAHFLVSLWNDLQSNTVIPPLLCICNNNILLFSNNWWIAGDLFNTFTGNFQLVSVWLPLKRPLKSNNTFLRFHGVGFCCEFGTFASRGREQFAVMSNSPCVFFAPSQLCEASTVSAALERVEQKWIKCACLQESDMKDRSWVWAESPNHLFCSALDSFQWLGQHLTTTAAYVWI